MIDNEPDLDIIDICTPYTLHAPQAKYALNAGKNVIIEKPMCIKSSEVEELIITSVNRNMKLTVSHNYKFLSNVKKAKQWISDGSIGNISHLTMSVPFIESNWPRWMMTQGGPLLEVGTHALYLTMNFLGDVINADGIRYGPDNKNILAHVHCKESVAIINIHEALDTFKIAIYGDKGTIRIPALSLPTVLFEKRISSKGYNLINRMTKTTSAMTRYAFNKFVLKNPEDERTHFHILNKFAEAIMNDSDVPVPAQEGQKCVYWLEKIEESTQ